MKRIIILLFVISAVLTSCGNTNIGSQSQSESDFPYTESDDGYLTFNAESAVAQFKYHDGHLYFNGGASYGIHTEGDGVPTDYLRMNLKTGNVISVCSDPLCRHDFADCPIYGIGEVAFLSPAGDLYFLSQYFFSENGDSRLSAQFIKYDLIKNKVTVLEAFENGSTGFGKEIYTDDYRFYHGMFYDANRDEHIPAIMRMKLSDGKTEPFAGIDSKMIEGGYDYTDDVLFTIDDRLYLTDSKTLYSVDFHGKNRINHLDGYINGECYTDGEYVYYQSSDEICRRSLSGGDEEGLGITPYSGTGYMLTENYIYYMSGAPVTLGKAQIYGYNSDTVTLEGGEFWRCKHDGSENELIYKFSGDTESYRPRHWIVVGNYIYASYYWWTDADGDGIFEEGDNHESYPVNGSTLHRILRIDVNTGEEYFIEIAE